ncbi:glycosyl hydrolase family 95 catalytic domain-containing protein [Micromonospora sp. SL1-18]|uniref:glycosyl hydrolase family 95 catalytic domain-containing protein n=1 Tax=Micromonospora sp. SL1-18 TaxID=3399128 RepID=UPI003A4D6154
MTTQQGDTSSKTPLKLWYDKPALASTERLAWERQALPIGNGLMGGMVFGRTTTERIQLNEDSLWTGGPGAKVDTNDTDAYGIKNVQDPAGTMKSLVQTAFDRYYESLRTGGPITGTAPTPYLPANREVQGAYQNFAEMYVDLGHDKVTNYSRSLDLRTATAAVSYDSNGSHYQSETFASNPDNTIVYHLQASQPGALDLTLRPEIPDMPTPTSGTKGERNYGKNGTVVADGDRITLSGDLKHNRLKFAGVFRVLHDGGELNAANPTATTGQLRLRGATSATIVVSLGTDYVNDFDRDYRTGQSADQLVNQVDQRVNAAGSDLDAMRARQLQDYQRLFSRVDLDLGGHFPADTPTDQLLSNYKSGDRDPYLEQLYFQFGRYLLISSSRDGGLPANLQGIWNDRYYPDWASDYHTNINLQMNYWPAFLANIAETANPLVDYVDSLRKPGRMSLAKTYGLPDDGTNDGFIFFCNSNPFGFTGNINSNASFTPTATAFIAQNLYDYYAFTGDKDYLRQHIYPILREASQTYLRTLQPGRAPDGSDHDKLFVVPSWSSEHGPWTVGTAFDQQLVYQLFKNTVASAGALGLSTTDDAALVAKLKDAMPRLNPVEIGADGQIKEWQQEVAYNRTASGSTIGDDHHRHNSQLVGLYPGDLITRNTPQLMEAAKVSLNRRGDDATGWSMGHKLNLWARTGDGNRSYQLLTNLLSKGTYNNLFDLHPPFQIDGNFGGTAGIAEMLLQSHSDTIDILPALPDSWSKGSVDGLRARGGFTVGTTWRDGRASEVRLASENGGTARIRTDMTSGPVRVYRADGKPADYTIEDGVLNLPTTAGQEYRIVSQVAMSVNMPTGPAAPGDALPISVQVTAPGRQSLPRMTTTVEVPEGWTVDPATAKLGPITAGGSQSVDFTARIPKQTNESQGLVTLRLATDEWQIVVRRSVAIQNLATNRPARQSSTYSGGVATRAVDGNTDGAWKNGSVTHTIYPTKQPWWEVDLERSYPLSGVAVWNRTDCCSERLSKYYVLVSKEPIASASLDEALKESGVHAFYQEEAAGSPTLVPANVDGRYVRVWLTSSSDPLSLAEVQVFPR